MPICNGGAPSPPVRSLGMWVLLVPVTDVDPPNAPPLRLCWLQLLIDREWEKFPLRLGTQMGRVETAYPHGL